MPVELIRTVPVPNAIGCVTSNAAPVTTHRSPLFVVTPDVPSTVVIVSPSVSLKNTPWALSATAAAKLSTSLFVLRSTAVSTSTSSPPASTSVPVSPPSSTPASLSSDRSVMPPGVSAAVRLIAPAVVEPIRNVVAVTLSNSPSSSSSVSAAASVPEPRSISSPASLGRNVTT